MKKSTIATIIIVLAAIAMCFAGCSGRNVYWRAKVISNPDNQIVIIAEDSAHKTGDTLAYFWQQYNKYLLLERVK